MWLWILFAGIVLVGFVAFTGAPYVPSKRSDLRRAFTELYPLSDRDVLVDIGSGDGVVLREASRCGARAVGYEIHPILVWLSRWLSRHDKRVDVCAVNFWKTPLPSDVTVVYTFGEDRDIGRMYTYVQAQATELNHNIMFISYAFEVAGVSAAKTVGAHHLYEIRPLQA